jgi:murein DD-endopeptidase MepM/ murein hydrolase activator NlpD
MKNKSFTFLYSSAQTEGLRTIRVPKWLFFGVLAFLVCLVVSAAAVLVRAPSGGTGSDKLVAAERENTVLRTKVDEYAQRLETLERQVQQNFEYQKKARLIANLDDLNEDVAEVGVGGPEFGHVVSLSILDEATRNGLDRMGEDIDKMTRQARLQRESYQEIIDRLSTDRELLDATPSIRPVTSGYVSSRFGRRIDPFTGRTSWHYGVDYAARLGTPIFATADGVVTFCGKWYEFGWTVEVSHGHGIVTRYAHCSRILVERGQHVKRGQVIARVGSSGRSTATHLHYEVIANGIKQNPLAFVLSTREVVD